jgi:hypothetical protein
MTNLYNAWQEDCKFSKKVGIKAKTYEEYVLYRKGKYKPKFRGTAMPDYNVSDHRERYPSGTGIGAVGGRKEKNYTGDKLLGIAVMHKSNLVPVFSQESAQEISKMRR